MIEIRSATFRNFRALRDVEVPFRRRTILVGANNVGKTSVLEGIEHALGVGRRGYAFDESDVTDGADPNEGFEIRVEFAPVDGGRFDQDEVALFGHHVDIVDDEHRLYVVIRGRIEDEDGVFRTRLHFAKSDGQEDGIVPSVERAALGLLLLGAVREARHEFRDRGGLWSRLATELSLSPEEEDGLQEYGLEVGARVVSEILGDDLSEEVASGVTSLLSSVLEAGESGATLSYSFLPADLRQALRSIDVRVALSEADEGRSVSRQSIGTQSVALFGLFESLVASTGSRLIAVGVEEPEAHLHPHAARSIVRHLGELETQLILTTHSVAITDVTDPRSIVRLRRRGAETTAHAIDPADLREREVRAISKTIADVGSDFVFARAVLLAEGASERLSIPVFASQVGVSVDALGVSVVPVEGNAFGALARLLGESGLAIPFAMVSDLDAATRVLKTAVRRGLLPEDLDVSDVEGMRPVAMRAGVFWWSGGDFEQCLLDAGAGPLYASAVSELYGRRYLERFSASRGIALPADPGASPEFLREVIDSKGVISKPLLARRVAELFGENGMQVPTEVESVIGFVADLAREEARREVTLPAPTTDT